MTTVRPSRATSGDQQASEPPPRVRSGSQSARTGEHDAPYSTDVPLWALLAGIVLVTVFVGVGLQAFSGRPTVARIAALVPGGRTETLADTSGLRVLYENAPTIKIGQNGIGTRG